MVRSQPELPSSVDGALNGVVRDTNVVGGSGMDFVQNVRLLRGACLRSSVRPQRGEQVQRQRSELLDIRQIQEEEHRSLSHTDDLMCLAEITLQGIPNSKYQLELFVGNQEIELQRNGNRTWTPVQRPYVPWLLTMYAH